MLSTTLNEEITEQARASLKGNWGLIIAAIFANIFINMAINILLEDSQNLILLALILTTGSFSLGFATIYLNISRNGEAEFSQLFSGFSDVNNYIRTFLAYLLMTIFIMLWFLLLIIPGIIAAYSYSCTFYILADNKSLTALEAITESKRMMQGYKWKSFCLTARFLGWSILCILTFGIGFIWLIPYIGMSYAKFYEDIKQNEADTTSHLEA